MTMGPPKRKLVDTYRALSENFATLARLLEQEETTARKPKRVKKEKDPNRPKKPSSAYIFFTQSETDNVKDKLGERAKMTDVVRELAKQWKDLSAKEKQPFIQMATESAEQYKRELDEYLRHKNEGAEIDDDEDQEPKQEPKRKPHVVQQTKKVASVVPKEQQSGSSDEESDNSDVSSDSL